MVTPTGNSSPGNTIRSGKFELKTEDFIKMMIVQLQNQDPMEPAKNQELLAQMSQIGQLQSATNLQQSLKTMVLQNNLGAAGNLIGKMVKGMSPTGETLSGVVSSVRVEGDSISLELDNGYKVPLERVTEIAPPQQNKTAA
jgi:flagellar basal-body rod modification protein FlgD